MKSKSSVIAFSFVTDEEACSILIMYWEFENIADILEKGSRSKEECKEWEGLVADIYRTFDPLSFLRGVWYSHRPK